ncbi:hypothetical protein T4E_7249 [Trichinella pseudospiralis]|uniref:Uncharacterized protein n=1 Tax=Trichinella pseudospiralis TaxID=6337 RepID=A0A0V0XKQ4_TRIPS|nr:hypothetical protein T4E_7249 [Trichinella pseudospiralis]
MDEEQEEIVNTPSGSKRCLNYNLINNSSWLGRFVPSGRESRVRKVNQRVQEFMRSYLIPSVRHSEKEESFALPKVIHPHRIMKVEASGKYLPSVIASRENWLRVENGVAFCMACQCILRIRKFSIKWGDKLPQSDVAKLLRHEKGVNHEKAVKKYMNDSGPNVNIRYAENSDYSCGSDDSFEQSCSTDVKSGKTKKKTTTQHRFMKKRRIRILKRRVRLIGCQKPIIVRSSSFPGSKKRLPNRVGKRHIQCACRIRRLSLRLIQCDSCHFFQHPGCAGVDCSSPIESYFKRSIVETN